MRILYWLTLLIFTFHAKSQTTFPVNGVKNEINTLYAFTHATIYTSYNTRIENATMLVKADKIISIGTNTAVPKEAVEINCTGKNIYPAFIDAFTNYGMPDVKREGNGGRPQYISNKKGAYCWNEAIRPEADAVTVFSKDEKAADGLRMAGFGAVYSFQHDGIARGTGTVVTLGHARENEEIIKQKAGANYSFNKGSSSQDYPSSLMGSIALLRQTYYDAQWYKLQSEQTDLSLKAFNEQQNLPQFFEAGDKWNVLRADKIGDEFKIQYIIKTDGSEYQRIAEMKAAQATFIVPVNFPAPFRTEDAYDVQQISTTDMMHWYYAPNNLFYLQQNNIPFCITSDGCDASTFLSNLRKAVQRGLPEQDALKGLTQGPAALLNISESVGSLKAGMLANFFISSGNIFDNGTIIYESWVRGSSLVLNDMNTPEIRGIYQLNAGNNAMTMNISGTSASQPKAKIFQGDSADAKIEKEGNLYSIVFEINHLKYVLSGWYDNVQHKFKGNGNIGAENLSWEAIQKSPYLEIKNTPARSIDSIPMNALVYPFTDFGNNKLPVAQNILIKNATVWTNETTGVLTQTDVLLVNGKISQIGKNITAPAQTKIIDGTGFHLTPGIIDEHSHIAISGDVNEGTQSVTSEVRIGDVVYPEDINIYRQLAGGVTTSHLLHGSANAIGGQTQLIKLRWGKNAEQMKFEGWDGFIKFALGENVKQSNWGDRQTVRFPQTRMGVEQVMYDAFGRAKTYELQWKNYKGVGPAPRRDLELDALVEILNKKRFITCHSYVQSEINMLMHVGDSMGFTVNTFTHILEGYKVADKMKAHGANASTFADWWAYKFEVYDAIPYNSALMTRAGLNVAVNSDDAEMARRLNQEAAKAMKYGGLTAEEALKLCTLNPAKMLHIDQRVGSIKIGKDADLVLWSEMPLSIYAKPLYTMVDGVIYFDYNAQAESEKTNSQMRAMFISKMNEAIRNGEKPNAGVSRPQVLMGCDGEIK